MTPRIISYDENNFETIQLVGFRVQPEPNELVIYALVLYYEVARGDKNRPLTNKDGRIVVFPDVRLANAVLSYGDSAFRKYAPVSIEQVFVYDIPKALEIAISGASDPSGDLVNLINELLDFVDATPFVLPSNYRTALESFADYATFNDDIAAYLDRTTDERVLLRDSILWIVGGLLMSVQVVI
jgi:hypothetical protein